MSYELIHSTTDAYVTMQRGDDSRFLRRSLPYTGDLAVTYRDQR